MMKKQSKQPAPPAPLFQPKPLRFEDVNWSAIYSYPDFAMMGLCNRHVVIDQSGRDWYGLPFIEDELAAPAQGIPYVLPFTKYNDRELNSLLWKLELLSRRHYSSTERSAYNNYLERQEPGARVHTPEAYFLRRVYEGVCCHYYPSPRIARVYIIHQTAEELQALDAAEERAGYRVSSNLEKFAQLDYIGLVIFTLEGLVRSMRQTIYFEKLTVVHDAEQRQQMGIRKAISQAHWARVDQVRDKQFKERVVARRANPEVEFTTAVEQLDIFQ